MNIDPNDLLLFATIADTGSFTAAAERLGLPKSSVSRRLSALERTLGERLMQRTTRKLRLTEFGTSLLEPAREVAAEVETVVAMALSRQAQPSGRLKVSMPGDFAGVDFARLLAQLVVRHPGITLDLDVSSRHVDLIGEGFDLAVRMGDLPDDTTLAAQRLVNHEWGLYAAPVYLALRGHPALPDDLPRHDTLALRSRSGEPMRWTLLRGAERWSAMPAPRAMANSPDLLTRLAVEGMGIAALPERVAQRWLAAGALVRVLPAWCLPPTAVWAVTPGRKLAPPKTRAFLDMLKTALAADAGR
jgi:DNA-binding transcriptional LysR family regulator